MERLPRRFWILFGGSLVNRLGSFVVPLFAIYLKLERGLSPLEIGGIASCYGLGSLLSGPIGGHLADRLGRRGPMIGGLLWSAAAMLLVPLAHHPAMIALASFHLGLAGDLYRPAFGAAVADLCTPAQRPRAYALIYWASSLGFSIATAIGGALARSGFARLFVLDAATTIAYAFIVFFLLPETSAATHTETRTAEPGLLVEVLGDRVLLGFLAAQVLVGLLLFQSQAALPIALAQRGIGSARYGLVIAENGVLTFLLQPFAPRLLRHMRRTHVLAAGALLIGLGFGLNAPHLGLAGAGVSVAVWTLGEIVVAPIVPALLADLAPARLRGRYQGLGQMSFGVCTLFGPAIGMLVLERASSEVLWIGCAIIGCVAAALFLSLARPLSTRLAARGEIPR